MNAARQIIGLLIALCMVGMLATFVLENLSGRPLVVPGPGRASAPAQPGQPAQSGQAGQMPPQAANAPAQAGQPDAPRPMPGVSTALPPEQMARLGEYMARLQANPHDADLLLEIGRMFLEAGEAPQAENFFRRAAIAAPADPRPHHFLGMTYTGAGAFSQAAASFEQAIALGPDPSTLFNLAIVYRYYLNSPDKARPLLERVAAMPEAPAALRQKAREELQ